MIVPIGPAMQNYDITKEDAVSLLRNLKGSMVRWTSGFQTNIAISDWYAVICDQFIPLDAMKSSHRYKVNRGLNNCEVRRIEAEYLAQYGYDVYLNAMKGYQNNENIIIPETSFSRNIRDLKVYEDIFHLWGCFYKDKLIAYTHIYVYGDIEANYSTIKFHPEYLKLYPSEALFYTLNSFYLDNKVAYVNDGFRSILHSTNIQEFLIRKFNFKKQSTKLNIIYKFPYSIFIKGTYPIMRKIAGINKRLDSLYELERIRKDQIK